MIPQVRLGAETGYIFGSQIPDSFCFVPEWCVTATPDGRMIVDEKSYFLSGWSVRNMRWSDAEPGGSHLFPDAARLIVDISSPAVKEFRRRVSSRSRHPFVSLAQE
jgi:hypothetical protein